MLTLPNTLAVTSGCYNNINNNSNANSESEKIISKFLIQATWNAADREKVMCIEVCKTIALL